LRHARGHHHDLLALAPLNNDELLNALNASTMLKKSELFEVRERGGGGPGEREARIRDGDRKLSAPLVTHSLTLPPLPPHSLPLPHYR